MRDDATDREMVAACLAGRSLDPLLLLGDDGEGETIVLTRRQDELPVTSDASARAAFVALGAVGGLALASIASSIAWSASGHALGAAELALLVSPVAVMPTLAAALFSMSADREFDVRHALVRRGREVAYVRSYATCRPDALTGRAVATTHVSIARFSIGQGRAERGIAGVLVSDADAYEMEVPAELAAVATVPRDAFSGTREAYVPDCFDEPLGDVLGDWVDGSSWAWHPLAASSSAKAAST